MLGLLAALGAAWAESDPCACVTDLDDLTSNGAQLPGPERCGCFEHPSAGDICFTVGACPEAVSGAVEGLGEGARGGGAIL